MQLITMLKSKIHRATVTEANLNYQGSITVDSQLIEAAGLIPYEKVQLVNLNNGERFETYLIEEKTNQGTICLNGAAARKAEVGDLVIILAYSQMDKATAEAHRPTLVWVDENNQIIRKSTG